MITCKIVLHDIGNTCPVCGEQALDAAFDGHENGEHIDTFKCDHCGMLVTYISPDDGRGEYHQFHDGEITVEIDVPIPYIPPYWPVEELEQMLDDIITQEEAAENDQGCKFLIELVQRAKDLKDAMTSSVELPEELKTQGFYSSVNGVTVHVLGDPDMSDETLVAIQKMVRAAMKMEDVNVNATDNPASGA